MTTQRQVASGQTWRRTRRVLIVDDDPNDRARLNALFAGWQWDVLEASSGREALDLLDHHAVDVVFVDAAPPGTNCAVILDAVRRRIRDLPVIVMGAPITPELRRAWRSRGAMECLTKPVEPQTLSALLFACEPPSGFADS
jgi:CheY-like chemotaxis protein